jgi:hypothetical protein
MLSAHRLRKAVCEASEALRRVSEIIAEDRECCEARHSREEHGCEHHHHHHHGCDCGCEHHETDCKKEEHRHEGSCEEEHEHCCHRQHHCCDEECHEAPYPPFPPYPPYPVIPPYPPFPPYPPIIITSGCGCQHSGQAPGVTVAGYPGTYTTQTAGAQTSGQPAAAHAPAANLSLNAFPDLTNITNLEALLSLAESVAAQVGQLIPSESQAEEAG